MLEESARGAESARGPLQALEGSCGGLGGQKLHSQDQEAILRSKKVRRSTSWNSAQQSAIVRIERETDNAPPRTWYSRFGGVYKTYM